MIPSTISTEDASIKALVDNIERLDITPLERARCYYQMLKEMNISARKLADCLGVSHTTISHYLEILKLPQEIQKGLDDRKIGFKHVLVIMKLPDRERQILLYRRIVRDHLSLTDTKFWCTRLLKDDEMTPEEKRFDDLEEHLMKNDTLNTWINDQRLRMVRSRRGERITINVSSPEELRKIVGVLYESLGTKAK